MPLSTTIIAAITGSAIGVAWGLIFNRLGAINDTLREILFYTKRSR